MGRNSRNFGSKHSLTLSLADDNDNGVNYVCQLYFEKAFIVIPYNIVPPTQQQVEIRLRFIFINYSVAILFIL